MTLRTALWAALALGIIVAGCCPATRCPAPATALPLETVVAGYNDNAGRIPRLSAHAKVGLILREKPSDVGFAWGGTSGLHAVNARLLLAKNAANPAGPQNFYLSIREAGQELAKVGISLDDEVYYGWFRIGDQRQAYVGQLDRLGASSATLAIDPVGLMGVLGVVALPNPDSTSGIVVQRVLNDPCCYAVSVIDRIGTTHQTSLRRVVYFDRLEEYVGQENGQCVYRPRPVRPFRVELYDPVGRILVTADLSEYESVVTESTAAVIPTRLHLKWHANGTEMNIKLSNMTTTEAVDPAAFEFYSLLPADLEPLLRSMDASASPTLESTP